MLAIFRIERAILVPIRNQLKYKLFAQRAENETQDCVKISDNTCSLVFALPSVRSFAVGGDCTDSWMDRADHFQQDTPFRCMHPEAPKKTAPAKSRGGG